MSRIKERIIPLRLKKGEEDRLNRGHLWVFSNELEAVPADVEPGTLAVLESSRGKTLGMGFFNPRSLIAFRLLAREPAPVDADFFRDRLEAALNRRRLHLGDARSFRLAFGESDGLPGLVADKFEDAIVLQPLSAGMDRRLELVAEALQGMLKPRSVYAKCDHPSRALEGLGGESRVVAGEAPGTVEIEESGIRYRVDPAGGQKTGFYFDQRENRLALAPYCAGKTVLDFHCYTGGFALTAAKHGARKVYALDSSEPAVELARANAELNGLDETVQFDTGDADEVLAEFSTMRREARPDVVVLDPPSLVPSKKHASRGLRALARLNANAFRLLPNGGIVATSTCSHHIDRGSFLGMLREAAGKAQKTVRIVETRGQAKDHPVLLSMPETEYLHFAILEVQ